MMYNNVPEILPRTRNEDVHELLQNFASLVEVAINFGTHILQWEATAQRIGDFNLPPVLFLRNILDIGDAISILIRKSAVDPCKPLLRSLLENMFYLEYVLENNSQNRAMAYLVWHAHEKLKFYKKQDETTGSGRQFKTEVTKDKFIGSWNSILDESKINLGKETIQRLLDRNEYQLAEEAFQKASKKKKNPAWYSLFDGPQNIEQLAKHLNHHASYEILYRGFSGHVHATSILQGKISINEFNEVEISQIRNPEDSQSVTQNTTNILVMAFSNFIIKRLPNKTREFDTWYSSFRVPYKKLYEEKYINIIK